VSRTWNEFIIPRLYQSVHLSTQQHAAALLTVLENTPSRRFLLTSLILTTPSMQSVYDQELHASRRTLRKLFRKLPSLKRLHLLTSSFQESMTFLKDSLRAGTSLTCLNSRCYGVCIAMDTQYIWSILKEFQELEEFFFEFNPSDGRKMGPTRTIPSRLKCPRLKRLAISGVPIDEWSIEKLSCICGSLEVLEIDGNRRY